MKIRCIFTLGSAEAARCSPHPGLITRSHCTLPKCLQIKAFRRDRLQKGRVVGNHKENAVLPLLLF